RNDDVRCACSVRVPEVPKGGTRSRKAALVLLCGDGVELESPGDAFEFVFAAVFEVESGSCDEVDDGAGDERLAGPGEILDSAADVDGDAGDVVAGKFDLSCVHAGSDLETERVQSVDYGQRAAHGAGGTIEGGQETVACGVHFAAAVAFQLSAHDRLVRVEEHVPAWCACFGGPLCGGVDVGEHDRGQNAVRLGDLAFPGEELLNFAEHGVLIAAPGVLLGAGKFDELCPRDALGEVAAVLDAPIRRPGTVHDQRGDPHRRQYMADVGLGLPVREAPRHLRAG